MMTWNYRILDQIDEDGDHFYRIHEVYYEGDGKIKIWSKTPIAAIGNSPEELRKDLEMMLVAFDKPVLNDEDLPGRKG